MSRDRFIRKLKKVCRRHHVTNAGIAGIYGNARHECGDNWDPELEQHHHMEEEGNNNGKGHFQFDAKRDAFEEFSGGDWSTAKQIEFIFSSRCAREMGQGNFDRMLAMLRSVEDPEDAAEAFMNAFLIPAIPQVQNRRQHARDFHDHDGDV